MAISGTTSDYTGRTVDLFISQGINPTNTNTLQPITYSFGQVSAYVTGVQKLVQRYVISLCNTGLLQQLQSNQSSNIQEATHIFNFASWDVVTAFQAYQQANPNPQPDEVLSSATLTDLEINAGVLNITVQITTTAGSPIIFVLPLTLS